MSTPPFHLGLSQTHVAASFVGGRVPVESGHQKKNTPTGYTQAQMMPTTKLQDGIQEDQLRSTD